MYVFWFTYNLLSVHQENIRRGQGGREDIRSLIMRILCVYVEAIGVEKDTSRFYIYLSSSSGYAHVEARQERRGGW